MSGSPRFDLRWIWTLLVAVLLLFVVQRAAGSFGALAAAFLVAYALEPVVAQLQRWRIPRSIGAIVVLLSLGLIALGIVAIMVPTLAAEFGSVVKQLDLKQLSDPAHWPAPLAEFLTTHQQQVAAWRDQAVQWLQENADILARGAAQALKHVFSSLIRTLLVLLNVVMVPVFAYYLMVDWERLHGGLDAQLPHGWGRHVSRVLGRIDRVLRAFLQGQLRVALAMAALYALGLGLLGVPLGIPIGIAAGLLNMVPYLGVTLGLVPALMLDLVAHPSWLRALLIVLVFVVVQNIEGWILTPRWVGGAVGMHPLTVLLAVVIGGELFGFAGLLLAVPGAAVIAVLWSELREYLLAPATPPEGAA